MSSARLESRVEGERVLNDFSARSEFSAKLPELSNIKPHQTTFFYAGSIVKSQHQSWRKFLFRRSIEIPNYCKEMIEDRTEMGWFC